MLETKMRIRVGYDICLNVGQPAALNTLLDIEPARRKDIVSETPFTVTPDQPVEVFTDVYGNTGRRLFVPAGLVTLSYRAQVSDSGQPEATPGDAPETPVQDLPAECLPYLTASRYCETDSLGTFAWNTFGSVPAGGRRAQAVADYVHNHLEFDYMKARATRTAAEALEEGDAVCRDFTHLTIALCRALNMPARYCNGFLGDIGVPIDPNPMDFCAWCEIYIGGRWYTFDARHNEPRIGRIVIARGRDAADVPMMTTFGHHTLSRFEVIAEEIQEPAGTATGGPLGVAA
jgi:transglutaminase-like putative cysteine protease